jgi:hypothetical protein
LARIEQEFRASWQRGYVAASHRLRRRAERSQSTN